MINIIYIYARRIEASLRLGGDVLVGLRNVKSPMAARLAIGFAPKHVSLDISAVSLRHYGSSVP